MVLQLSLALVCAVLIIFGPHAAMGCGLNAAGEAMPPIPGYGGPYVRQVHLEPLESECVLSFLFSLKCSQILRHTDALSECSERMRLLRPRFLLSW
jgi:hypothetical protein